METHLTFVLTSLLIGIASTDNILVVFPIRAKSHWILGNALSRGLVEAGHNVTYLSPFPDKNPLKEGNYTDVLLKMRNLEERNINFLDLESINPLVMISFMAQVGVELVNETFEDENFKKLINSDSTFDLIIMEQFFNDAMKVIAWHYKAPLIMFSTIGANFMVNNLVGNSAPPSYVPDVFSSYTSHMGFFQRLFNALMAFEKEVENVFYSLPTQNNIMKKFFPDSPDLHTFVNNVSLVLANAHESVNYPVPLVPNMINIGGFHLRPAKELSEELKSILDNAKEGVVYFSLGSNIDISKLPKETKTAILKALGNLKQTVLIKWQEDLSDVPQNVILRKWYPQQEILAHPNVKLFVTHGGLLSTLETIYHGVPVLLIPFFGDQKMNANKAVLAGYGLAIPVPEVTEQLLGEKLNELLGNPKYTENVKQRSMLMKDRPVKPLDLAVYWCEFVIRHKGAPHLQVAAVDLAWYQYYLLDVISFIVFVSFSIVYIIYRIIRSCCSRRKQEKKLKKA